MGKQFDFQPQLIGAGLCLRPLSENDFDALYSCASDKKIWEGHPNTDRYKAAVFKDYFAGALKSRALVVIDRTSQQIIGSSRYYWTASIPDDISIGFTFLTRAYWGGETNFKVKQLMLDYAFDFHDVVWFHVSPTNIRSQKATLKIGAEFTGEEVLPISGRDELWFCYRIEKQDWLNRLKSRG